MKKKMFVKSAFFAIIISSKTTLFHASAPYCMHCAFIDDFFFNGANSVECYKHYYFFFKLRTFYTQSVTAVTAMFFVFFSSVIEHLKLDVSWCDLDYQIVDTHPGTV